MFRDFDWTKSATEMGDTDLMQMVSFLEGRRGTAVVAHDSDDPTKPTKPIPKRTPNPAQRAIIDTVVQHAMGDSDQPLRAVVYGCAGTGKSSFSRKC